MARGGAGGYILVDILAEEMGPIVYSIHRSDSTSIVVSDVGYRSVRVSGLRREECDDVLLGHRSPFSRREKDGILSI